MRRPKTAHALRGPPCSMCDIIRFGYFRQVRLLVHKGVDVDCREDGTRLTPLLLCAFMEPPEWGASVAMTLLEAGARPSLTDVDGRNALHLACIWGRERLVRVLLRAIDFDLAQQDKEGNTALHLAAMSGEVAVTQLVAQAHRRYKVGMDKANVRGLTAGQEAMRANHESCFHAIHSALSGKRPGSATKDSKDVRFAKDPPKSESPSSVESSHLYKRSYQSNNSFLANGNNEHSSGNNTTINALDSNGGGRENTSDEGGLYINVHHEIKDDVFVSNHHDVNDFTKPSGPSVIVLNMKRVNNRRLFSHEGRKISRETDRKMSSSNRFSIEECIEESPFMIEDNMSTPRTPTGCRVVSDAVSPTETKLVDNDHTTQSVHQTTPSPRFNGAVSPRSPITASAAFLTRKDSFSTVTSLEDKRSFVSVHSLKNASARKRKAQNPLYQYGYKRDEDAILCAPDSDFRNTPEFVCKITHLPFESCDVQLVPLVDSIRRKGPWARSDGRFKRQSDQTLPFKSGDWRYGLKSIFKVYEHQCSPSWRNGKSVLCQPLIPDVKSQEDLNQDRKGRKQSFTKASMSRRASIAVRNRRPGSSTPSQDLASVLMTSFGNEASTSPTPGGGGGGGAGARRRSAHHQDAAGASPTGGAGIAGRCAVSGKD